MRTLLVARKEDTQKKVLFRLKESDEKKTRRGKISQKRDKMVKSQPERKEGVDIPKKEVSGLRNGIVSSLSILLI